MAGQIKPNCASKYFCGPNESRAQDVRRFLEAGLAVDRPPRETIEALGPKLLGLLVGDLQIRHAIESLGPLTKKNIAKRSDRVLALLL